MLSKQFLLNKDGSYPNEISPLRLEQLGLIPVIPTDPPINLENNRKVEEQDPELVDGAYYQKWAIVPLTEDEIKAQDELAKVRITQEESN